MPIGLRLMALRHRVVDLWGSDSLEDQVEGPCVNVDVQKPEGVRPTKQGTPSDLGVSKAQYLHANPTSHSSAEATDPLQALTPNLSSFHLSSPNLRLEALFKLCHPPTLRYGFFSRAWPPEQTRCWWPTTPWGMFQRFHLPSFFIQQTPSYHLLPCHLWAATRKFHRSLTPVNNASLAKRAV